MTLAKTTATLATAIPGTKTPTGLQLPGKLSLAEWGGVGVSIGAVGRASLWWIGDWINYGEMMYGESYAQYLEETGYASQTLLNAARVSRLVAPSRRREELDWSHHEVVCGLTPEQQSQLLNEAVVGNGNGRPYTISELRARVRALLGKPPAQPAPSAADILPVVNELMLRLCNEVPVVIGWPEFEAVKALLSPPSTAPTTKWFLLKNT